MQKVYDFVWSEFCDWYIELSKAKLYEGTEEQKQIDNETKLKAIEEIMNKK